MGLSSSRWAASCAGSRPMSIAGILEWALYRPRQPEVVARRDRRGTSGGAGLQHQIECLAADPAICVEQDIHACAERSGDDLADRRSDGTHRQADQRRDVGSAEQVPHELEWY